MDKKGICPQCQKIRWLGGKDGHCKPCAYPIGRCARCSAYRKIYVDSLCYLCYQDRQVRATLLEVELHRGPIVDYDRHLFQLYLTYIRRYWLRYCHLKQARRLGDILILKPTPLIQSWAQIYSLAQRDGLYHQSSTQNGCAWLKIGYMLQELGVLSSRGDEYEHRLQALLSVFNDKTKSLINRFLSQLIRLDKSDGTLDNQLCALKNIYLWVKARSIDADLLSLHSLWIQDYLEHLQGISQLNPTRYMREQFLHVSRFYRWCKQEGLILLNPCDAIQISRSAESLCICSPDQIQKLSSFYKDVQTDPEQALLIILVLIFGFTTEDLAFAQLSCSKNQTLEIILRRKARTAGRRYFNRPQTIQLPREMPWFFQLQRSYYQFWLQHYAQIKKTYPYQPLFLDKSFRSNRPLSTDCINERFKNATLAAVGSPISIRIVRQTCGHLYSQVADTSILSRLGWSPQFAFHYTWLPRTYIASKKSILNSSLS